MTDRFLEVMTTSGVSAKVRVVPTPVPGLVIGASLKGKWAIISGTGDGTVGRYESPEAALAAAMEMGPLLDWTTKGQGAHVPQFVIDQIDGIIRRWDELMNDAFRVLVTASRDYGNRVVIRSALKQIQSEHPGVPLILVHGMCDPRHRAPASGSGGRPLSACPLPSSLTCSAGTGWPR